MKESIGAAWLMIIVMTFITVFSGYLAFSINYSKSFRVKDGIVERIQKHNGITKTGGSITTNTLKDIDAFLNEIGYNAKGNCDKFGGDSGTELAGINGTSFTVNPGPRDTFNYCLVKVSGIQTQASAMNACYYKVIVFFSLQIGSISLFSQFHTQGQTQTLYYSTDELFGDRIG